MLKPAETDQVQRVASQDATAAAAPDQSPFALAGPVEQQETATPTAAHRPAKHQQQQPQQHQSSFSLKRLLTCGCIRPQAAGDSSSSSCSAGGHHAHQHLQKLTSRNSNGLVQQPSTTYTDADWFSAHSQHSGMLTSAASDDVAKLHEVTRMARELTPSPPSRAPWIPEPALVFSQPGIQFVPVPAHTGYAAYWMRDPERSTPYPCPIDKMVKASFVAQKSHASIPGMWLQETDTTFSITVKPAFVPPGLPRYTETYDKSMLTEPSWPLRRDLCVGSTSGEIFMTTDGMLVLRARSRPFRVFGGRADFDYVMEEYLRLEEGGQVVVDRQCCLEIATGNKAVQYLVGRRYDVPPKGHV